jgi:hypothetical protein
MIVSSEIERGATVSIAKDASETLALRSEPLGTLTLSLRRFWIVFDY